ncbi:hypothetical protein IHE45_11G033300 [Dioscorea alata]|uniref:Uncharacterized protein n=1 Tax=Dioscorea alata TaxID=55571 RepID=A0ACB7V5R4_DIOAL|nr:hypothetical protein IHE45_11G033300 [Dioscorea alata]
MARSGMKVNKSFKRQAFVEVANIVNGKFPTASMDADNQKYQEIKKLMNFSGMGWNDTEKMLVLEDETYRTYVEGQPKAKEYLNKPIPFFEELLLVVGDDHATGDKARCGGTNEEDENPPTPDVPMEHEPLETIEANKLLLSYALWSMEANEPLETNVHRQEGARSSAYRSTARTNCMARSINENIASDNLANKLGELAASIKENKKKTWKDKLSYALWSMKGYSDADMDIVFEKLRVNKDHAEAFYLRKPSLHKLWLDNFIASMRDSGI